MIARIEISANQSQTRTPSDFRLGIIGTLLPLLLAAPGIVHPAQAENPPAVVEATPALRGKIKILALGQAELRDSLRLPARVGLDQQRVARIGASVTGRLTETRAMLGQEVKKGEVLATLNSTELSMAQSAYLKAASQVNLHRLAVARARRLLEKDVIAAAELLERESELGEAEVDQRAAADQLRVMGMSEQDMARLSKEKTIHSFSPVTASLSGVVIERNVTLGQVVQPSDALFTVADLSHVWLSAEASEQNAPWMRVGDEASAEIPALPGREFKGKLIYVADLVNPETRTVTVRMDLYNPQRLLKPQMLATLVIRKAGVRELVVPDSAAIRENGRDHVFVETAPYRFELRPVGLGEAEDGVRPVLTGLKAGERIVTEGAFHLNNERLRKELGE